MENIKLRQQKLAAYFNRLLKKITEARKTKGKQAETMNSSVTL
jgi:hypothetical protein